MGSTAAGLAVIVGAAGILIGWNARSARGAHGDLKVYKTRIPPSAGCGTAPGCGHWSWS